MAHTIITRNHALAVVDAECDRMHMPAYTDVAYALKGITARLREALDDPNCPFGFETSTVEHEHAEAQRILNLIKGETE